ncbi:MAG: RNA polymerase factor sigma-54 [Muribaculum sp.]|nr:RNA polymerase factor sigma-54 [Muribaculum sp.]
MASKNSTELNLSLGLRQKLSQQQLRYVKMLELTAPELDEAVAQELEDNPALEAADSIEKNKGDKDDTPYYLRHAYNRGADDEIPDFSPMDSSESLYDYLLRQISERKVDPKVAAVARYIAGNVDNNGYIDRSLQGIVNDMEFNQGLSVDYTDAEKALSLIHSLEPAGVGAFDLRQTLLLQLDRMPKSSDRDNSIRIIRDKFPEFTKRHFHKLQSSLGLTPEEVRSALELISGLNPKPGSSFGGNSELGNIIIPDFIVENHDGELTISLNNNIPELNISESFKEAVDQLKRNARGREARKGKEFYISRYNDANEFLNILKQRQETMMMVMTAIVKIQHDYFITEDVSMMKPMMLKDIEKLTGLDKSTISRVTKNKFAATPWGILPLRHFFSDTIGDNNEDVLTNRRIESEIRQLVDHEDKRHPLSDEKICRLLIEKGFDVSRRTIAKYRDRIGVPASRLRKDL